MLIKVTLAPNPSQPSTIAVSNDYQFIWGKSRKDADRRNINIDDLFIDDLPTAFEAMVRKGFADTRRIEVQIGRLTGTLSYHTSPEALVKDSVLLGYDEAEAREQAASFDGKAYCLGVFDKTDFRSLALVNKQDEPLAALLGFAQETFRGIYDNGVF